MIILRRKIQDTIKANSEKVEADTTKALTKIHAEEIDALKLQHEIAMADKAAEIDRLNNKIDRLVTAAIEVEKKRIQAGETMASARAIVHEIADEISDKFDALRHIHGVCDRAKRALERID